MITSEIVETLDKLSNETTHLSYHDTRHPTYRKLIDFGEKIVPILLAHLRTNQDPSFSCKTPLGAWWCIVALTQLTRQNPIKNGHEGQLKEIVKDWLEWDDQQKQNINVRQ